MFRTIRIYINPDLGGIVTYNNPAARLVSLAQLPAVYAGEIVVFAVSMVNASGASVAYADTDTFELAIDDNFLHTDTLMARAFGPAVPSGESTSSDPEAVNLPEDDPSGTLISPSAGKFTVRVNCNTVSFFDKLGSAGQKTVNFEIKRYPAGQSTPTVLAQSVITAKNVVALDEGEPEPDDPLYYTTAQTIALLEGKVGPEGPAGPEGHLTAVSAWSSSSAYAALTCLAYQGGGYQVISATSAGESPDTNPGKFICFASKGADGSNGSDGVTPVISGGSAYAISAGSAPEVSATSSGGIVYFDFGIPAGPKGDPGAPIASANISVSSLTSGAISVTHAAFPVALKTNLGNLYPIEKRTLTESSGTWIIDPAAYLAYDNVSGFTGPWTVYFAGGLPEVMTIISAGVSITPNDHQVYKHTLAASDVISIDTSALTSSQCLTFELWLDMPSTAVAFTLPVMDWIDGGAPDFSSGDTRYVIVIRWNGTGLLANLAYTEDLA